MTIALVLQGKGSAIETIAGDASVYDAVQRPCLPIPRRPLNSGVSTRGSRSHGASKNCIDRVKSIIGDTNGERFRHNYRGWWWHRRLPFFWRWWYNCFGSGCWNSYNSEAVKFE